MTLLYSRVQNIDQQIPMLEANHDCCDFCDLKSRGGELRVSGTQEKFWGRREGDATG